MQLVKVHCHAQRVATDCKRPVEKQTKPDVRKGVPCRGHSPTLSRLVQIYQRAFAKPPQVV